MENIFKIESEVSELEISDGFIRLNHSAGHTDIRYDGNFTLKQMGECLEIISLNPSKWNGHWVSNWQHGFVIAVEFDDTEDHINLCMSCGYVYITFGMKKSTLPNLIQFFYNNHK